MRKCIPQGLPYIVETIRLIHYLSIYTVRPSAPRNVRVTSSTSTSLYVHWTTPQYPNGTLTAYTIRCSSPTHNYNSEIIRETYYGTYYTVTGLEVFTAYECCVSATNTIGESNQECVSGKSLFGIHNYIVMYS